jgi:hypothetical protein
MAELAAVKNELENMASSIGRLDAKLDTIVSIQTAVAQLQERSMVQHQAIDRAFAAIQSAQVRADQAVTAINRAMAFVRGAAITGALLFAFGQWYMLQQLESVKGLSEASAVYDRRLFQIEMKLWPDNVRPSEAGGKRK